MGDFVRNHAMIFGRDPYKPTRSLRFMSKTYDGWIMPFFHEYQKKKSFMVPCGLRMFLYFHINTRHKYSQL